MVSRSTVLVFARRIRGRRRPAAPDLHSQEDLMSRLAVLFSSASLALAAAAGLAGCSPSAAPAPAAPPAPQVGVVTIQPRQVALQTVLPGRTAPTLIAEVRPQVTGLVKERNFREGAEVRAGSALYQLEPATYQAAHESAKAALARAEASRATARLKAARMKELVAIKFVSQQDYDEAAAALQQSEADVVAATAAVETARINLGYTKVTAPISGRIGKSAVTPGALVTANQATALATIQQLNPIYVDLTQSSTDVLRLKRALAKGELKKTPANAARVALLLDDGTPYAHEGSLQFSDVTVDPTTGAITLRALFPNPQGELLPGMYVRAVIEEGVREGAIVVPQQAVTRDNKGDAIALAVGADGKVEQRKLSTVRTLGSDWLIDAGLQAGDRVIVDGLQRARPGMVVQTVEAAPGKAAETDPKGGKAPRS
jgi:membrane fusion protein (multidrug efflux system)